jgi:hypothetical protein
MDEVNLIKIYRKYICKYDHVPHLYNCFIVTEKETKNIYL